MNDLLRGMMLAVIVFALLIIYGYLTSCTHTHPPYEPPTKEERGFAGISTPMKEQGREEK